MTEQIEATYAPLAPVPPVDTSRDEAARAHLRHTERERIRRARAAHEAKLARLRLYSYCLTLAACVLALMSFMYLAQGIADGDSEFTSFGAAFVAATFAALWSAIRVSKVDEPAT